jgi:hypothetical protein
MEAELVRRVVDLAEANERFAFVQVSNLQEQLHLSRLECDQLKRRVVTLELEKSDDELKQRVVTLEQEKSDFLVELSSPKGLPHK